MTRPRSTPNAAACAEATRRSTAIPGARPSPLPEGAKTWATSRVYEKDPKTALGRLDAGSYEPLLKFPSGGDTSYAGMVWHGGELWVSYYASHEGKSSVYLARVKLAAK